MKNNIIITAGGTSEAIDNVRKITNTGTGKLGCTIANKLLELKEDEIEKIYYICSSNAYKPDNPKVEILQIFDTNNLKEQIEDLLKREQINYFIHSMAVSDYTVDYVTTAERMAGYIEENLNNTEKNKENIIRAISENTDVIKDTKISSYEDNLIIKLKRTPKIISLIKDINPKIFLVGFKLLDNVSEEDLINVALKLKEKNNCDLVVANDSKNISDKQHKAFVINDMNNYVEANGKEDIAIKIIEKMFEGA